MGSVIVSRHMGAIEWLAEELSKEFSPKIRFASREKKEGNLVPSEKPTCLVGYDEKGTIVAMIPILAEVKDPLHEIQGKRVYGNLPLDISTYATEVYAIIFPPGKAPRGADVSAQQMRDAGAQLIPVVVKHLDWYKKRFHLTIEEAREGGYCC